jgi:hypothetical protein
MQRKGAKELVDVPLLPLVPRKGFLCKQCG